MANYNNCTNYTNYTNATTRLVQPATTAARNDCDNDDNEEDSIALGLGFVVASSASIPSSSSSQSQQLVQDLMQQCLAYHQDQLFIRQQPTQHPIHEAETQVSGETLPPSFVTPVQPDEPHLVRDSDDPEGTIPATTIAATNTATTVTEATTHESTTAQAAQEAVARARAIIQSFQRSATTRTTLARTTGADTDGASASSHINYSGDNDNNSTNNVWKLRRDIQLQIERQRLDHALFKNFTYLEQREQQRLQQQLQQIDVVQQQLEQKQQQQQQQMQQRRRQIQIAGIGAEKRRLPKRTKFNSNPHPTQRHDTSTQSITTIALYLANLSPTTSEELIRHLFKSYGQIQKVHFYHDKQTGAFKGDGLVIYEPKPTIENPAEFLQSICQQVSE